MYKIRCIDLYYPMVIRVFYQIQIGCRISSQISSVIKPLVILSVDSGMVNHKLDVASSRIDILFCSIIRRGNDRSTPLCVGRNPYFIMTICAGKA